MTKPPAEERNHNKAKPFRRQRQLPDSSVHGALTDLRSLDKLAFF